MKLTDTKIRRLKPSCNCTPSRPDKYSDGNGLQLYVRVTGNKTWIFNYRYLGKQKNITIGSYPDIGLAEARAKAREYKAMLNTGKDPKILKVKEKSRLNQNRLFSAIADEWYKLHKERVVEHTYSRDYSAYMRDIRPVLGDKLIDDITPSDILAMAMKIKERGASDMANRAMNKVSQIFRYAIQHGVIVFNPADGLRIDRPSVKERPRVAPHEVKQLINDIKGYDGHILVRWGLLFIAYTAVRAGELTGMRWQELDLDNNLWRIPAERMKMRRPHIVPLVKQTLAILESIKELGLSDEYVFFNRSTNKPFSREALNNALKRLGYQGKQTTHGLRGVVSTSLNEMGYRHHAIELQLAHDSLSKVEKAYNNAEYLDHRKKMMADWADYLDSE